jgi:long-chain acyl-CoA synthetase
LSNVNHFLESHVNQRGSQTALVDSFDVRLTWSQLHDQVMTESKRWIQADPAIPIVHRSENRARDVVTALAIAVAGRIEAPLDDRLSELEMDRRCELLSQRPRSSVSSSIILWTSGTTSQPMGVIQQHASWLGNAAAKLQAVPTTADDVRLTVLPLSHAYARTCDLGTWLIAGGTLAVGLGMKGLRKLAPMVRPTVMNVVPSMAHALLCQPPAGLQRLRWLGVGGAALSTDAFKAWRDRGVTVIQGYGLTETGPVIASATPKNAAAGWVGNFVQGWEREIRDGELWVRGPHLFNGYWNHDSIAAVDANGWFRTGDHVRWDSQTDQLRVLGRVDDVIVLPNAIKINPSEIEQQIALLPGVRHCMLCLRKQLELWIDGDETSHDAIRRLLLRYHPWGNETQIRYLDAPLSIEAGELTSKMTLRRSAIRERIGSR